IVDVHGNDVEYFDFFWIDPGVLLINVSGTPPHDGDELGMTRLGLKGNDETKVRGVFARLERTIEKAYRTVEEAAERQTDQPASISIGSISVRDGSVAISGAGDALSSSAPGSNSSASASRGSTSGSATPSPATEPPSAQSEWWNNPWVVAVLGGAAAAILAGI